MNRQKFVPIQYTSPRAILTRGQNRGVRRWKENGKVLSIDENPKFVIGGAPMTARSNSIKQSTDFSGQMPGEKTSSGLNDQSRIGTGYAKNDFNVTYQTRSKFS